MYTKDDISTFESGIDREWIVTNGLGGFASSTIIGANTRKYHGLLFASFDDEIDRMLTLSRINEYVVINGTEYTFSSNECHEYVQDGFHFQKKFMKGTLPEFEYILPNVCIHKTICMVHGKNKVVVEYEVQNENNQQIELKLIPLVNYRSYHKTSNAKCYEQNFDETLSIKLTEKYELKINVTDSEYEKYDNVFYNDMYYRIENYRGLDDTETHNIPGVFKILVAPKSSKKIIFSASAQKTDDKFEIKDDEIKKEKIRLKKICRIAGAKTEEQEALIMSADSFIIDKAGFKTIIAGYPWFLDWGRDAFVSFEGLLLKTNRYSDAKSILKYFSQYIKNGLVPNYIADENSIAYNSVDASLWFIDAVYKYYKYTNDKETIIEIYPKLEEIISSYQNGTLYNIKMDSDGLIVAGDENTQLTWMDAKVGDTIPTPRYGKAVEINALWYNALRIMEELSNIAGTDFNIELAPKVKESFRKFYNDYGLFDTIEPFNAQVRPNQLFAIGLEFSVISGEKAGEILDVATANLFTNKGLRTLTNDDLNYVGTYSGDTYSRDISYHQGTVWPWLIDIYSSAYKKVNNKNFVMRGYKDLLIDDCIGSVAEIYDGDEPRLAKGAFSQAWSVSAMIKMLM